MNNNNLREWVRVGAVVRVKSEEMRAGNPAEWRDHGVIAGLDQDTMLTEMNQRGLLVFRARVTWPSGRVDSLLPSMLEPFPTNHETKHPE